MANRMAVEGKVGIIGMTSPIGIDAALAIAVDLVQDGDPAG